jgi:hypothetical protein
MSHAYRLQSILLEERVRSGYQLYLTAIISSFSSH